MKRVSTDEQECLSDYEATRLENIARNNAQLRALGLISALEEYRSNTSQSKGPRSKKSRTHESKTSNTSTPVRQSLRLNGTGSTPITPLTGDVEEERKARVTECRAARLRAAAEVVKAGIMDAKENLVLTTCCEMYEFYHEAHLLLTFTSTLTL